MTWKKPPRRWARRSDKLEEPRLEGLDSARAEGAAAPAARRSDVAARSRSRSAQRGGGGGGGGAGRDLESLFDLELDTEKNQYETGAQSASADRRQKEIDEALQKLEQLARRQQELAQQQRDKQQSPQQRWQQEMLRREAEELKKKMEELARGQSGPRAEPEPEPKSAGPARAEAKGSAGHKGSRASKTANCGRRLSGFHERQTICVRRRARRHRSRRRVRPKLAARPIV